MNFMGLKIILLILTLNFIFNKEIAITNYETIKIEQGIFNFTYIYENISSFSETPYFYFLFSKEDRSITFEIIDENGNINNAEIDDRNWIYYKLTILKKQKFTFRIINKYYHSIKMMFIDSASEIKINLDQLASFQIEIDKIKEYPKPLIIFIEQIEEDELYYFLEDNNLFYCVLGEDNECDYNPLKKLNFEKNKKYKIKYDCSKGSDYFYFKSFSTIKELKFEKNIFYRIKSQSISNTFYKGYFFIDIKNKTKFLIYINDRYYDIGYFSEKDKNELPDNIKSFSFERSSYYISNITNINDYVIIKVDDSASIIGILEDIIEINSEKSFEINKVGDICLDITNYNYDDKGILISSNKNIDLINSSPNFKNLKNILILNYEKSFVYVNSTNEKSIFKYYRFGEDILSLNSIWAFNLIYDYNINNYLNKYNHDSFFTRKNIFDFYQSFRNEFTSDLEEQYYLYIKKYYGLTDIYKYNNEINEFMYLPQFFPFLKSYETSNNYKLINNKLIKISGYQLFSFDINYNSLYDIYIQKIDDSEFIQFNTESFKYNNFVKLLIANKTYYINFIIEHIIKLDKNFSEAEITFKNENGKIFYLNETKRILDNLEGDNITVKSTKNALIYFYKKIPNYSEKNIIIFDKSQKGKNMKFEIQNNNNENVNIRIVKDFGIPGCYPMKNSQYWENINSNSSITTIYVENYYDKVNYTIDEEESYIIYLIDTYDENNIPIFNSDNYKISDPVYFESLLTPGNKYNFEVIKPNTNGALILEFMHKENQYQDPLYKDIQYQFITCNNKMIKFKIENSKGYFDYDLTYNEPNYPYESIITQNKSVIFHLYSTYQTLVHTFESEDEFLLYYTDYRLYNTLLKQREFKIISIEEIKPNIIRIIFYGSYSYINKYHLILTKKDENNNINSFSDLCYVAKLMIKNSDKIVVKTIYNNELDLTTADIDINKLNPNENDEFIISIIEEAIARTNLIYYSGPKEFKLEKSNEAKEIKLEEEMYFDLEKSNYFKFEYNKESDNQTLYFFSNSKEEFYIILFQNDNYNYNVLKYNKNRDNIFKMFLSGVYYIKLVGNKNYANIVNTFNIFITGGIIDTIDFSKKMYKKNFNFNFKLMPNPLIIKVNNLTENRNVYLHNNSYPTNPLEICNDNTNECTDSLFIYKFLKNNNYTIYVTPIPYDNYNYYFPSYLFLPILKENVEEKEEGYYILPEPKIYTINLEINDYLFITFKNEQIVYLSLAEKKISLENFNNISFEVMLPNRYFYKNESYKYAVLITIPSFNNENQTAFIITNKLLNLTKPGEYIIQKGENPIIYYKIDLLSNNLIYKNEEEEEYQQNPLSFYNTLITFSSPIKNMKIIFSSLEPKEQSDFIVQNTFYNYGYPIYLEKSKNDITITIKEYEPKYTFFGVANSDLFKSYFKEKKLNYDLSRLFYNNILHFRVNSNFNSFYEFFNFYFYDMEENINIYIKQYFGNSELYEFNPNLIDKKDFSFLNKPSLYSNKTSVLNKMINLKGRNKLFMGYLDYNSLFDVYLELENNITKIDISSYMQRYYGNAVKFLKKNIEYSLNFDGDYLIKLEEGFDSEVYIYNNTKDKSILNSSQRISYINGANFKINSTNDVLVIFYKKLEDDISFLKIDPKEVGKNLEIKANATISFFIDIGFEGYYPCIFTDIYSQYITSRGNIFIENIYDKLKVNLTEGENYYFYYKSDKAIETKYTKNLNNKNNEYSFIYIPKNSSDQTLIINNINKKTIIYQINFCYFPHSVKLYYQDNKMTNESLLELNNETRAIEQNLQKLPHKLRFDSENDFIFSYSFIDETDSAINDYKKWNEERKELTNLIIEEITNINTNTNSDIISVKFKPNYINSTARYILIISQNNENNTFDNFNNPCYITKLVNEKAEGYKIINIFDNGENDSINVEVDINEILGNNDTYIINIISQELRFEKKINYYKPNIFTYEQNKKDDEDKESDKEESDKEKDDDDDFPLVYVICFGIAGLILLLIILFFIIHYLRKRKNNDLNRDTQNIPNEKLLQDI